MIKCAALLLLFHTSMTYAEDLPVQHTVQTKDTLWDLAQHYYHDPFKWPHIAQANPAPKVKDPHWIYPSQVLEIPALEPTAQPVQDAAPQTEAEAPTPAPASTPAAEMPKESIPPKPAIEPGFPAAAGDSKEGLSYEIPGGLVSLSDNRFIAKPGWRSDGVVKEDPEDGEHLATEDDIVSVRITALGEVRSGDKYFVLRESAPTDADEDQRAHYVAGVGVLEIRSHVSGNVYRAFVLKMTDAIQAGDLLKRSK